MRAKIIIAIISLLAFSMRATMAVPFKTDGNKAKAAKSKNGTNKNCIKFSITNIKNPRCMIYIAFYKEPDTFLKKGRESFSRAITPTGNVVQNAEVCDVEPGVYAVAVMQDLYNDGEMRTNILGLPEDPYGFSNVVHAVLLPPPFKECSFYVQSGTVETVNVRLMNP